MLQLEIDHGALFASAPVPMWVFEADSLRFLAVNDAALQAYGYGRDEFLSLTLREVRVPRQHDALHRRQAEGFQGPSRGAIHRRSDGTEFHAEAISRPIRYQGRDARLSHILDVSARVFAEAENARLLAQVRDLNAALQQQVDERTSALARQEALFRTLAEHAPIVIWTLDAAGEHTTFFNRAWCELVGGTPQEWSQVRSQGAVMHPDDRAPTCQNLRRALADGSRFEGTRRLRSHDGGWRTTTYRAAPVLSPEGEVQFWVGAEADITEFKAAEAALRRANEELEAFTHSVSHDLRAPLAAIGGFTGALSSRLAQLPADDKAHHYLTRIAAGAARMEELVQALLSLARVTSSPLDLREVNLSALAREAAAALQEAEPHRKVAVTIEEGLSDWGDAALLRVVLDNLLGNARKFTAQQSVAEISFGRLAGQGPYFVCDNGAGFDMAHADKLFGAFQRLHTTAEFEGTGIGLATVRRVIARHGGTIDAFSAVGAGAMFRFTLG